MVELRSDNTAGVLPEVLAALAATNTGTAAAYGADDVTAALHDVVREVFEHPTARVFPVASGTAANALALSAMCPPWGGVLCHRSAHILVNECGSTSMFGAGAIMIPVDGADFRMEPAAVEAALAQYTIGDPHHSQPTVLSFTQPTDFGTVYPLDDVRTLAALAHTRNMRVHLDGARLANAVVALGCSPADITWRAGIDVFTLGATKNGAMSCDAIVCFDDRAADELVFRTKRAGHVASKMRFQSAQLVAYLTDGAWLRAAGNANAQMTRLAAGLADLGVAFVNRPDVNMLFAHVDDATADRLEAAGVRFYRISPGVVRFVTSWMMTSDDVDAALAAAAAATTAAAPTATAG